MWKCCQLGQEEAAVRLAALCSCTGGSSSTETSAKVPSVIYYDDGKAVWGFQVGPFKEAFRGIKLLLDDTQSLEYALSIPSRALSSQHTMHPLRVIGDYLQEIINHAKIHIQRRFGITTDDMNLRFTFTVPVVW